MLNEPQALEGLYLPTSLSERRSVLEKELRKVVIAQLEQYLQDDLKEILNKAGFTEGEAELSWEFYGEYDDEGGTTYYPSGLNVKINGEYIDDFDELTYMKHPSWADEPYESNLYDGIHDVLYNHHTDLFETDTEEVTVKLG